MIKWILALFGYEIRYVCEWGEFETRYDGLDRAMSRPVHQGMSVAPPWAKMKIRRIDASKV